MDAWGVELRVRVRRIWRTCDLRDVTAGGSGESSTEAQSMRPTLVLVSFCERDKEGGYWGAMYRPAVIFGWRESFWRWWWKAGGAFWGRVELCRGELMMWLPVLVVLKLRRGPSGPIRGSATLQIVI